MRFIPACAGNSTLPSSNCPRSTVHPRVCGELAVRAVRQESHGGSSPRVRGTQSRRLRARPHARFIPACAGNSRSSEFCRAPIPVHPRVCGELLGVCLFAVGAAGSSPRVRGTHPVAPLRAQPVRFIPACAGNSPSGVTGARPRPRFIPACAGNSSEMSMPSTSSPVHPRVCGELIELNTKLVEGAGSSPRVRGTLGQHEDAQLGERFIPACAGNSVSVWCSKSMTAVHPRVCGELLGVCLFAVGAAGSSPRVRGTRRATAHRGSRRAVHPRVCGELARPSPHRATARRFIPACAGNSYFAHASGCSFAGSSPRVRGTRRVQ